ncbi:hypothetical protein STAFG_8944 [Streptomyces afghaniensis 772]|uniref:Uncharacterized protein n=1 Tax=Streptomyces afghaniensis 772 TaxID=1283301 RepID=S4MCA4_9ACTN|nr:hypothetical protein STAFG_8944 [Streptomyces afghaniensis 772]
MRGRPPADPFRIEGMGRIKPPRRAARRSRGAGPHPHGPRSLPTEEDGDGRWPLTHIGTRRVTYRSPRVCGS